MAPALDPRPETLQLLNRDIALGLECKVWNSSYKPSGYSHHNTRSWPEPPTQNVSSNETNATTESQKVSKYLSGISLQKLFGLSVPEAAKGSDHGEDAKGYVPAATRREKLLKALNSARDVVTTTTEIPASIKISVDDMGVPNILEVEMRMRMNLFGLDDGTERVLETAKDYFIDVGRKLMDNVHEKAPYFRNDEVVSVMKIKIDGKVILQATQEETEAAPSQNALAAASAGMAENSAGFGI